MCPVSVPVMYMCVCVCEIMSYEARTRSSAVVSSWRRWLPVLAVAWPGTAPAARQSLAPSPGQGRQDGALAHHRQGCVTESYMEWKLVLRFLGQGHLTHFYPFNPVAHCRKSILLFSNSSGPDQRAPVGAL